MFVFSAILTQNVETILQIEFHHCGFNFKVILIYVRNALWRKLQSLLANNAQLSI